MYLVLIFLPLFGSILAGIFGRKLGVKGVQIITNVFVIITTIISFIAFFEVGLNNTPVLLSLFT
jgi:NADH:ubiquinone oxidoreductase subunit 5 (subunit L)/multisubunit Na+/H+ antiporter MnhA subunit